MVMIKFKRFQSAHDNFRVRKHRVDFCAMHSSLRVLSIGVFLHSLLFGRCEGKPNASGFQAQHGDLVSEVYEYCIQEFVKDPSCCLDSQIADGVYHKVVRRHGTAWKCTSENCWDARKGDRGDGLLWAPHGADCATPRILYIHGGSWEYGSPFTDGYDSLGSHLAALTGAVVYLPDYPLSPVGNFHTILQASLDALDWLAHNGPADGLVADCGLPVPPIFIGGDSSGGGTALSTLLKIMVDRSQGPYHGDVKLAGGFFFSPWTNLKCNTPDYYHHAFAKIIGKSGGKSYVGDVMFRSNPHSNKDAFTGNAVEYVGNNTSLLTDPIASPLYAEMAHWRGVPPLYFAVGGAESILGDSVLLAQKAAHKLVEVQLDIFEGMWHVFPMYSEGCGSGRRLWQATAALTRTAKFVRSIAYNGRPACSAHPGEDGATPFTVFHYNNPESGEREKEWFPDDASCAALLPSEAGSLQLGQHPVLTVADGASSRDRTGLSEYPAWMVSCGVASITVSAFLFWQNARLRERIRKLETARQSLL